MGFWNWFGTASKVKNKRKRSTPLDPEISQAFSRVKRDIKKLQANLTEINTHVAEHGKALAEHTQLFETHTCRLDRLEQLVNTAAPVPVPPSQSIHMSQPVAPTNRLNEPTHRLVTTNPATNRTSGNLDIQSLSPQEKRILQVFLTHRNMALSYQDIGKSLNKSPNTIKNQLRQMNMKSSLFDKTIDADSKNRFKLRKHLKIETDLDTV